MNHCDLLIENGLIVDGNGGEPFIGDVAIEGTRILSVGAFAGQARERIDATGKIVTPGFVDVHTHYDGQAIWSEELSPSSAHGVTTVVTGNCGVGFAPCRPEDHQTLIRVMEGVEDIPGVVMAEGLPWDWETFPQFLDALDARAHDIDLAAYLPHSPLRVYVMGERGARREAATADDLARMKALAHEALDAGAIGLATSRLVIHRTKDGQPIPSYAAADDELCTIAEAMTESGKGVFQVVLDLAPDGWDSELDRLMAVVESSRRPATFTMATANSGAPTWPAAMERIARANAAGADICAQVLPRPIGVIGGFALSTHPFCLCPSYQPLVGLPLEAQLERLRDPAFRQALLSESPAEGHPLAMLTRNWNWMFPLSDPPDYAPPREASVAAQAQARSCSPEEVAYEILMNGGAGANDGRGMLYNTLGNFHEGKLDALHELMTGPDTVPGLGDGGAHYAAICDASYPTFMLSYWVRDRDGPRLTLAQAVKALAADPARLVQLHDRGRIAPGFKADLNVIDLDQLALHRPVIRHDLPGGGRRLDQAATGYHATICSGQVIRSNDRPTGARPGKLVRGRQDAPAERASAMV